MHSFINIKKHIKQNKIYYDWTMVHLKFEMPLYLCKLEAATCPKAFPCQAPITKATKNLTTSFTEITEITERLSNRNFSLGEMVKELLTSMR